MNTAASGKSSVVIHLLHCCGQHPEGETGCLGTMANLYDFAFSVEHQ